MSSLVAEVITVAVLDYKRKRVTEEAKTAKRDGRKYAGEIARKERDQLRVFIFGGSMDWMIDLADLNVSAQAIREKLRGRR